MTAQLGTHFTLAEFCRSSAASRAGLVLDPSPEVVVALRLLVGQVLDPLRASLGSPVRITSGYRSAALNTLLKGSRTSQHVKGEAADIKADGYSAEDIALLPVTLGFEYDQVIWYVESRDGHVHVSYTARRANRRQLLHAPARGGYVVWVPVNH